MPVPVNRSKIMPARGTKAVLEESLAALVEGEMAYATDEQFYYQKQGGVLVPVGAPNAGAMTILTENVDTTDGNPPPDGTRGLMKNPPELPAGWTELTNQREVNWWIHREVENVANRTTINEQQLRSQAERIQALENVEGPELEGYATTEALQGVDERLKVVEFDYTTTNELNAVNSRVTKNSKEITELQEGFDAAVIAAQEGAENITIELQSYASKEELEFVDGQYKLADENILKASQQADTALGELIAANTKAIEEIEIPDVPDVDLSETVYSAARISEKESLVWAGQKQMAPQPNPGGSIGWHYTSAGDGTKAHWTLWSQDRDAPKKLTLADVYSYSLVLTGKGMAPYLQVNTKRKNDGNDAASTYRSRVAFQLPGTLPPGMVSLAMLTTAADCPLYANLAHLVMGHDEVSTKGPCEDDEEITKVVLTTNSAAAAGDFDFMVSSLVLHTKQGTYDTQLEFTGLTEAPEAPDVDLEGYATEAFVESALENYASTGELGAAEIRIGANESDIKDLQDAVEAVDLAPYAYTEYVDRADGLLHERIVKLEDAPPPQAQIDWDLLPELK